ncbi:MAG: type I methionyl aminopeptidase [Oscillospiraceae bacterium]|jgi:methionyl aminopeptidase|nr:type I methionyl aminopeptidase [Oscillospiraceae bacterium]
MVNVKNPAQIEKMRTSGQLLYEVLQRLREMVQPGITTEDINRLAHKLITENHAVPSFLNYKGFPKSLCTSLNEHVVHGIPDDTHLREGDIIGIDCGLILDGWHADSAFTVGVGTISAEAQRLIDETERCFWIGARNAVKGNRIGDIGHAVSSYAHSKGYDAVHALTGHGIGRHMHEDPEVPNFGTAGKGLRLMQGMTIAIEPMITQGTFEVDFDGWIVKTRDRKLCSHYEHTMAVTVGGLPDILTLPRELALKGLADG